MFLRPAMQAGRLLATFIVILLPLIAARPAQGGFGLVALVATAALTAFDSFLPFVATFAENGLKMTLRVEAGQTVREALEQTCAPQALDAYLDVLRVLDPSTAAEIDTPRESGADIRVPTCPTLTAVPYRVEKGDTLYTLWLKSPSYTFEEFQTSTRSVNRGVRLDQLREDQIIDLPTKIPKIKADVIVPKAAVDDVEASLQRALQAVKSDDPRTSQVAEPQVTTGNVGLLETALDGVVACTPEGSGATTADASDAQRVLAILGSLRDNAEEGSLAPVRILVGDTGLAVRHREDDPPLGEVFSTRTVKPLWRQREKLWASIAADESQPVAHHGTYVATQALGGVLFAPIASYVLPNLTISLLRLDTRDQSNQLYISEQDALKLFDEIANDTDIKAVNLSISFDQPILGDSFIERLERRSGMLFVAAAGNVENRNIDDEPAYPASYAKSVGNVIAVAAVDKAGKLAKFSSFGPETVQLAAPGCGIAVFERGASSKDLGQVVKSGTSLATPTVAWTAGLIMALQPGWPIERVKNRPDYPCYSSGDDDPVRMGCCPRAGVGQTFGQGIELVAAVEAPGEAGQVALGVLGADVMVGAGERRLDVAERGVDPGKGDPLGRVRPRAGDHGEVVAAGFADRRPAGQAVADHVAAGGEVALGQRRDLLLAEALDHRQPQPARLALGRGLDRRHERRLAGRTAAALAAGALPAEIGVVHLHPPRQLGLLRLARRHRRHQLVLDQPGGRLPRAEPPRQLDRTHPALALREVVDRQEPDGERQFGPVEHGARGQPDLALAAVALVDRPALQFGIAGMAAARARPAFAPAELEQRRPALRLGPEPLPELALTQPLDPPPNPTLRTHPLTPPRPKPAWMLARGRLGVTDNQENRLILSADLNLDRSNKSLANDVMYGALLNVTRAISVNRDVLDLGLGVICAVVSSSMGLLRLTAAVSRSTMSKFGASRGSMGNTYSFKRGTKAAAGP